MTVTSQVASLSHLSHLTARRIPSSRNVIGVCSFSCCPDHADLLSFWFLFHERTQPEIQAVIIVFVRRPFNFLAPDIHFVTSPGAIPSITTCTITNVHVPTPTMLLYSGGCPSDGIICILSWTHSSFPPTLPGPQSGYGFIHTAQDNTRSLLQWCSHEIPVDEVLFASRIIGRLSYLPLSFLVWIPSARRVFSWTLDIKQKGKPAVFPCFNCVIAISAGCGNFTGLNSQRSPLICPKFSLLTSLTRLLCALPSLKHRK